MVEDNPEVEINNDDAIQLLEGTEKSVAESLLDYVHDNIQSEDLSYRDWIKPLKADGELWLTIFDVETGVIQWLHYSEQSEQLCVHPVNDWDGYEVNEEELRDIISEPDNSIQITPRHMDNIPIEFVE